MEAFEIGQVETIMKNGRAEVRIEPSEACEGCHMCATASNGNRVMIASNDLNASEGQKVRIELFEGSLMITVMLVFALPVALFLSGTWLGWKISGNTWGPFAGAIAAFGAWQWLLKYSNQHWGKDRPMANIVEILPEQKIEDITIPEPDSKSRNSI